MTHYTRVIAFTLLTIVCMPNVSSAGFFSNRYDHRASKNIQPEPEIHIKRKIKKPTTTGTAIVLQNQTVNLSVIDAVFTKTILGSNEPIPTVFSSIHNELFDFRYRLGLWYGTFTKSKSTVTDFIQKIDQPDTTAEFAGAISSINSALYWYERYGKDVRTESDRLKLAIVKLSISDSEKKQLTDRIDFLTLQSESSKTVADSTMGPLYQLRSLYQLWSKSPTLQKQIGSGYVFSDTTTAVLVMNKLENLRQTLIRNATANAYLRKAYDTSAPIVSLIDTVELRILQNGFSFQKQCSPVLLDSVYSKSLMSISNPCVNLSVIQTAFNAIQQNPEYTNYTQSQTAVSGPLSLSDFSNYESVRSTVLRYEKYTQSLSALSNLLVKQLPSTVSLSEGYAMPYLYWYLVVASNEQVVSEKSAIDSSALFSASGITIAEIARLLQWGNATYSMSVDNLSQLIIQPESLKLTTAMQKVITQHNESLSTQKPFTQITVR